MKKIQTLCVAVALLTAACTPSANQRLTVTGTVERETDTLYIEGDQTDTTYAAVPVIDGKYTWSATIDTVVNMRVRFGERPSDVAPFIGEPGTVVINIPIEGAAYPSGTPLNDSINAYHKHVAALNAKANALGEKSREATTDSARNAIYDEQRAVWHEGNYYKADVLSRHSADPLGVYLLREFQFYTYPERIEKATQELRANYPGNFWTEYIGGRVEGQMRGAPGRKYTDLSMPTPDGDQLKLSDIVAANRYTYVDFWASWCGPCIGEIPHVKNAYEKYHKKGLEIVGVSFDSSRDNWTKAIADYGMRWPQMSDLKGWGCAAAKTYGVNAIPSTLLIGQDGIIIARDLRGDGLAAKLAELLP